MILSAGMAVEGQAVKQYLDVVTSQARRLPRLGRDHSLGDRDRGAVEALSQTAVSSYRCDRRERTPGHFCALTTARDQSPPRCLGAADARRLP
jgi:hypothetical protein